MLSGFCVLIVEDDPLIAMALCENVEAVGGTVAGPFSAVSEAVNFLTQAKIDAAIVDANLRDRDVTPLGRVDKVWQPFADGSEVQEADEG